MVPPLASSWISRRCESRYQGSKQHDLLKWRTRLCLVCRRSTSGRCRSGPSRSGDYYVTASGIPTTKVTFCLPVEAKGTRVEKTPRELSAFASFSGHDRKDVLGRVLQPGGPGFHSPSAGISKCAGIYDLTQKRLILRKKSILWT
jgi:hypothetical protein